MKVCGFTFVKNAVKLDFPVVEAIESILPLCDQFIVAVGDCEDGTRELISSIADARVQTIDTVWDPELTSGGSVLAAETNKALDAVPADHDWCFYIQADEVVHEKFHPAIGRGMEDFLGDCDVHGLIFRYRHFFGTYDYVADSRRWYRHEIRIIRNDPSIRSWKDAQGFRFKDGRKLTGVKIDAEMYHYGWVKPPRLMKRKVDAAKQYWSEESKHIRNMDQPGDAYDYGQAYDSLQPFEGTHPRVMHDRIASLDWHPVLSTRRKRLSFRYWLLYWMERTLNFRPFENKHYIEYRRARRNGASRGPRSGPGPVAGP